MGQGSFPGTPPFLPDPSSAGGGQDPTKILRFLTLLQQMKQQPDPMGATQQPQGGVVAQPRIAPIPQAPTAPELGVKMDPMSSVGTLPKPNEQPGPVGSPSVSNQLMSMMQPKAAATYQAIMGVSDFIGKQAQKKDESQKAEASNAAQALMSALEGAKTTGDYRPAEHILENNEALFNKVYKGWLQKSEEAKKPKKQEKVDPEVQGFEAGLASYMGKGAATQPGQPQPPSSLQGRSGAKYYMPQAGPQQAMQQQQQSQIMQQQRQAPGQLILTPEEQVKLQEAQYKLAEGQTAYQKAQTEAQRAEQELQVAKTNQETARQRGETAIKLDSGKITKANLDLDLKKAQLQNIIAQGKNIKARGAMTGKISDAYKVKFAALDQAEAVLDSMDAGKRDDFSTDDIRSLTQELKTAGASNYASSLTKFFGYSKYLPDDWTKPSPSRLRQEIKDYRANLEAIRDTRLGKESSDSDLSGGVDDSAPNDTSDDDPLGYFGGK